MRKRSIGFLPKSHRDRREGRTSDDGLVNHRELQKLVAELVSPDFLPYMFAWVTGGKPSPAALSLIPQRNGTVTATFGDLRLKVEPVTMTQGERGAVMTVDEARRAIEREGLSGVLWEGMQDGSIPKTNG